MAAKHTLSKGLSGLWTCSLEKAHGGVRRASRVKSLWNCEGNKYTVYIYSHTSCFLAVVYIQNWSSSSSSGSRGDRSRRSSGLPKRWRASPLKDSWLMSFWWAEPRGEAEAAGWLLRLEHMSYRFPENCIFLDSWRRDSQTSAASSGQPAIATLAQSWNSSQDLEESKQEKWQQRYQG